MATKRNKLEIVTMGIAVYDSNIRKITTLKHLADIFDDRRMGIKFVNHVFIIISKKRNMFIKEFCNRGKQRNPVSIHE